MFSHVDAPVAPSSKGIGRSERQFLAEALSRVPIPYPLLVTRRRPWSAHLGVAACKGSRHVISELERVHRQCPGRCDPRGAETVPAWPLLTFLLAASVGGAPWESEGPRFALGWKCVHWHAWSRLSSAVTHLCPFQAWTTSCAASRTSWGGRAGSGSSLSTARASWT